VDMKERKTVSLRFCDLILKYWLWRQPYHFKLYYSIRNSGSIEIEFIQYGSLDFIIHIYYIQFLLAVSNTHIVMKGKQALSSSRNLFNFKKANTGRTALQN
jgi:hypothetical protein